MLSYLCSASTVKNFDRALCASRTRSLVDMWAVDERQCGIRIVYAVCIEYCTAGVDKSTQYELIPLQTVQYRT